MPTGLQSDGKAAMIGHKADVTTYDAQLLQLSFYSIG